VVALVSAAALVAAQPVALAEPAGSVAAAVKAPVVSSAKDLVAAQVTARAQGARVEVEGLRTESSTTWVNPDGTLTTDQHGVPIRFRDERGAWRDIDLSLAQASDGSVMARSHRLGLSVAGSGKGARGGVKGSGESDLVGVVEAPGNDKSVRDVVVAWPGALGAPSVEAGRARYAAGAGVDVVVDSRRSGFELYVVIKDAAALRKAMPTAGGPLEVSLPLKTRGLTARVEADRSVSFVDAKGVVVSRFTPPQAWDGVIDKASGDPANVTPVGVRVASKGKGRSVLTLSVDAAWASDPGRVFPITVDPTYATGTSTASFDTYVEKLYPNDEYSTSTTLKVGTPNGGTQVARSFLTFPITAAGITGKQIQSATLKLYNTYSYSCTAKTVYVYSAAGANSATNWNNQPAPVTSYGSAAFAKGYNSSCAAAWTSIPVTSLVQAWAASSSSAGGIRLTASETDSYGWKHFASSETSYDPYISYTYNRKPNAGSTPVVAGNSYTHAGGSPMVYVSDSTPQFTTTATDPDINKYSATFEVHTTTVSPSAATKVATCATGYMTSGATVNCSATTALGDNKTLYVRAAIKDELGLWNGTWSPWKTFYTALAAPPVPNVVCPAPFATSGYWSDSRPAADVVCTVTAAGASGQYNWPGYVDLTVDGVVKPRVTITPSSDPNVAKTTVTFPKVGDGAHSIVAKAVSRSLVVSAEKKHLLGWGGAALTMPAALTASTGKVAVAAGGPPRGSATSVTAKLQWRVAASGNESTGWTDSGAPVTVTPPTSTAAAAYSGVFDLNSAVREAGASADVPSRTPLRLDVQVCFTYTGASSITQCTWSETQRTITRLPHAFGNGYPTATAGDGQVALYTGEVALSDTDVSVPGYGGDISVSRSHTSFAGDGTLAGWPHDAVTGVFGPGWTANLEGAQAGAAGMSVVDNTGVDGSIALVGEDGTALVYTRATPSRTYPVGSAMYVAATQDTVDDGSVLSIAGSGVGTVLTLTEEDGTATTWKPVAAPNPTTGTVWKPATITEPGHNGATTFGHDPSGRVTRIVAAVPDGMSGTACPTSGALSRGCRAIDITYAAATTATAATPGDYIGQVKSISAWLWNPATAAMQTTTVATYTYDTSGRLRQVLDPRTTLGVAYTWSGTTTRLASVTPTGLAGTSYTYDATSFKLTAVSREHPTTPGGAAVTTSRIVYGLPVSGSGLPDLSVAATTNGWEQAKPPVAGYAVFGQDYTGPVTGAGVDYSYADLSYVDDQGYTVNTAAYGAGRWLITATEYDQQGNVTFSLDANGTQAALDTPALTRAEIETMGNVTVFNSEERDTNGAVVLPAGTRVVDQYGPQRTVVLADGTPILARPHTHTEYDQGAPGLNTVTGLRYSLPTTITTGAAASAAAPGDSDIETTSITTNGYSRIQASDGDPWVLGSPSTVTTDGITRTTRLDTQGRTIAVSQPMSNGADAGTTVTTYYTADGTGPCANKPEWAGLICTTGPAAAPTSGTALPSSTTTAYTMWLHPATEVDTSSGATRTTTTTYDTAERAVSTSTTTAGLAGSTARAGTYTKYRADNGLIEYTGALNAAGTDAEPGGRTTTSYDRWARAVSVTEDAGVSTTTYNSAGQVDTISDPKGATTYTYDGAGERRGLLTTMTVTRGGSAGVLTYTADYDADGNITTQHLPGGIVERRSYDEAGQQIGLSYSGTITPVTETVDPVTGESTWTPGTPIPDQPWLTWSTQLDIGGRVRFEANGQGAAFDTSNGVTTLEGVADYVATNGAADTHQRQYRYTQGRLTTAIDAADGIDPATGDPTSTCVERTYTFNGNGNRTQLLSEAHPDGDCTSTTGVTTTSSGYAYDNADRATTGAAGAGTYSYDLMGRVTTIPAADSPTGQDITLGYFDDDLPRSVISNGVSTTFTLDAAGRRATQTSTDTTGTTTTVRRYTDGTDNPAWVETTPPGAATAITRFTGSIAGGLSGTITPDGAVDLDIADMRGNTATTITIPAAQPETQPAQAITGWATYTEYGTPTNPTNTDTIDGPLGYGWLGSHERSTTPATAGLTLMGVRYYNPQRGLFTALDPIPGGNENTYTYPGDPINKLDLDGRWSLWGAAKRVGRWAWNNRGTLASVGATVGCLVPAVGWAACAGMQAAAWGVRSQIRASQGGGWRKTWRASVADAGLTIAFGGMGRIGRAIKYGRWGGAFRSGHRAVSEGWRNLGRWGRGIVTAHTIAPSLSFNLWNNRKKISRYWHRSSRWIG
jgi:RHS repeat-associated protein